MLKGRVFSVSECKFVALSTKCVEMCAVRMCDRGDQLYIHISAQAKPNVCKDALCWPHQLFAILLGGFGMIQGFSIAAFKSRHSVISDFSTTHGYQLDNSHFSSILADFGNHRNNLNKRVSVWEENEQDLFLTRKSPGGSYKDFLFN